MKITVERYCPKRVPNEPIKATYSITKKVTMLLEALSFIKEEIDPSLTFSSGCRSGVCGSCGVRVNGKEVLACEHTVKEGDLIQPQRSSSVIKDLVVDNSHIEETIKRSKSAFLTLSTKATQSPQEEKMIERQSDCILCNSCYSACPILEVDGEFLGPFALTRAFRYVSDSRNTTAKETIDAVQSKGVWDCTLCGECTLVCPQNIDPKMDIQNLRNRSVQAGYMDPNFGGGFGGDDMFGGFEP